MLDVATFLAVLCAFYLVLNISFSSNLTDQDMFNFENMDLFEN